MRLFEAVLTPLPNPVQDFDDAAIVGQAWDDWAAFFDVSAKLLAAAGTVFAYAAGKRRSRALAAMGLQGSEADHIRACPSNCTTAPVGLPHRAALPGAAIC